MNISPWSVAHLLIFLIVSCEHRYFILMKSLSFSFLLGLGLFAFPPQISLFLKVAKILFSDVFFWKFFDSGF